MGGKIVYITKMTTQTKRSRHTQEPGAAFASIQKNIETPHLAPTQKKEKPVGGKTSRRRERERDTAEKPFKRFLRSLQSSPRGIAHTHVQSIESSPKKKMA